MTIPRLTTFWDEIAPGMKTLGETLPKLINPNADLQKNLNALIASNPELAGRLRSLEDDSPGTLESMGLGPVAKYIQKLPVSTEKKLDKMKGGVIDKISASGSEFSPDEEAQLRANLFGIRDPLQQRTAVAQTETSEENTLIARADRALRQALADIADITTGAQRADSERVISAWQSYPIGRAALLRTNGKLYEAHQSGDLRPDEYEAIMSNPELARIFDTGRDDYWKSQVQQYDRAQRQADRASNVMLSGQLPWLRQIAEYANVSPQDALAFHDLPPEKQQEYERMPNPPDDPVEAVMWRVARGKKTIAARREIDLMRNVVSSITATPGVREAAKVLATKTGDLNAAAQFLNDQLALVSQSLGYSTPPKYVVDTPSFWRRLITSPKVRLESGDLRLGTLLGKELGFEVAASLEEAAGTAPTAPEVDIEEAATELQKLLDAAPNPEAKQKILDRTRIARPDIYLELRKKVRA